MIEPSVRHRRTVKYTEPVYEAGVWVGRRVLECEVDVIVNLDWILSHMGHKACRNRSGQSVDGGVTVRRFGSPRPLGEDRT
jgi:hypothetical protein